MKDFNLDIKSNKYIYSYYLILYLICISWVNTSLVSPPLIARVLMTTAVFIPLVKYIWIAPSIIILFVGARFNSVAPFGYIPQDWDIYSGIIIICSVLHQIVYKDNIFKFKQKQWLLLLFITLIEFANFKFFHNIIPFTILLFLLYNSLTTRTSVNLAILSFVLLSITLATFYMLFSDHFVITNSELPINNMVERSTWKDPNYMGHLMGIGIVFAFYFILNSIKHKISFVYEIIFVICVILTTVVIIMQASRGAVLAFSISMIFILLASSIKIQYRIFFVVAIIVGVVELFDNGYFDLLEQRIDYDNGAGSGRFDIWTKKLSYLKEQPILLVGSGFLASAKEFLPVVDCHNEFISVLINYGIIGLLIVFFEIIRLFLFNDGYGTLVRALLIFAIIAFMTLSPISCETGWCGIPLMFTILYRLSTLK